MKLKWYASLTIFLFSFQSETQIRELLSEAGLPQMSYQFEGEDLSSQEAKFPSRVSGNQALRMSLSSLLHDDRTPETPLELFRLENMDLQLGLNRPSATLFLLGTIESEGVKAEYGEQIEDNWIFYLSLPEFSDHLFFIIVDRSGNREPYVYGFN